MDRRRHGRRSDRGTAVNQPAWKLSAYFPERLRAKDTAARPGFLADHRTPAATRGQDVLNGVEAGGFV